MSYTPPNGQNIDLSYVIDLLEDNNKCCEINTKYILSINSRLNRYEGLFRELLKCCEWRPGDTGVILPGGNVIPGQGVYPSKEVPGTIKEQPRRISGIRDIPYESYDTPYIPNGSVIDIPGTYKIDGLRYIDKSGMDLRSYLPYELNIKSGDIILEAILDYRIVKNNGLYGTSDVMLVYQTYNIKSGVRNTYEGGRGSYRNWYKIHYDGDRRLTSDGSMFQRGRIG